MSPKLWQFRFVISAVLIAAFWLTPISASAQDLVAVSSITGSSSVFIFRNSARAKHYTASKPARSKAQRMDSVSRISKQYQTEAKATPRPNRAKVVEPTKLPPNARTLPADQGSKLFAGVGEYYIGKGDYDQAINFFRDAVTLDETNVSAKTGMGEALAMKGNDLLVKDQAANAKGMFLEALKYDPKSSAAYFGLGEVYSELDQTKDAIESYEKSLDNDKGLTEIYVPLGILYYQAGDIAKADDLLTKAMATSSGSAETQFFLGLVRAAQNKPDLALTAFQTAKTIDPNYAEAYYSSGETLVKLKRASEAIPEYKKATDLKPTYFDAWLGLGQAQYAAGDYPNALISFQTASKLKNDNWEAYAGWGDAYLKTNKFPDAAAKLNLAATILTRTKDFDKLAASDLYSKVGFAYSQQCPIDMANFKPCQWPAAVKALEKAVELNGDPVDYTNLGWAYFNASRVDKDENRPADEQAKLALAKAALQKVVSSDPVIIDSSQQNLGAVLNDLGDFKGAIEVLKRVVDRHPEWVFAQYALGSAYAMVNDNDSSANAFRAALDKDPNYLPALKSLGTIEIRRKNGKEVRRIIEILKKVSLPDALALDQQLKNARL